MGYLADIYVIKESRSKQLGSDFLNHFLPSREEAADEYLIPQYSDEHTHEFDNADDLMLFLESNKEYSQSIYWRNTNEASPNKHGMIFYTTDGNMIFGISRNADMDDHLNTENEDSCLKLMKEYFKTVVSHKVCKAESYSEIFEPIKAQKNFGNNFLVI